VPDIRTPLTLENYLEDPPAALRLMLVEPAAHAAVEPIGALRREPIPQDAALVVGPEGGWDGAECAVAQTRGLRLMSLGPRTLRADAAPLAALTILDFLWGAS
jgi:16S rRNA (uracil1498-N3)-methyltransferase